MGKIIFKIFGFAFILLSVLGLISGALNLYGGQSQAYVIGFLMGNVFVSALFFLVGVKLLKKASNKRDGEIEGMVGNRPRLEK